MSKDGLDGSGDDARALEVEAVFDAFVRNANDEARASRTRAVVRPDEDADTKHYFKPEHATADTVPGVGRVLLLTRVKSKSVPPPTQKALAAKTRGVARVFKHPASKAKPPVVDTPRDTIPDDIVPDVPRESRPAPVLRERSEDGQIPAGELDAVLSDMGVLLRYGHEDEVAHRLDGLLRRYPQDLLLLRRVTELHLEHGREEDAMECLFLLATRLFERRNMEGMRKALEQVLVIDPTNRRAYKLLGLLDERPITGSGV